MGATDNGTQVLSFDYKNLATSQSFNKILHNILPLGLYTDGTLTRVDDSSITLAPATGIIKDDTVGVTVRFETTTDADIEVSPTLNWVIARFSWANTESNYVDFLGVASGSILSTDVIIGECNYTGSVLDDFSYNQQDFIGNIGSGGSLDPATIGMLFPFSGASIDLPSGWIPCDGRELSRTDYVDLYNIIGTDYGVGDGSTTFNIPTNPAFSDGTLEIWSIKVSSTAPQTDLSATNIDARLTALETGGGGVEASLIGQIFPYAGTTGTIPTGFASCDGSAVSRTAYATLFTRIGTTYGVGDGSTTFNIPTVDQLIFNDIQDYNTGWINRSDWQNVHLGSDTTKDTDSNVTHNLDGTLDDLDIKVLVSETGSDSDAFIISNSTMTGSASNNNGYTISYIDSDNIIIQTANGSLHYTDATGSTQSLTSSDWYYKIVVTKKPQIEENISYIIKVSSSNPPTAISSISIDNRLISLENNELSTGVMHVRYTTAVTVDSGSVGVTGWNRCPFNDEVENTISGASLDITTNIGDVTLPIGIYRFTVFMTQWKTERFGGRIAEDLTTTTNLIDTSSGMADTTSGSSTAQSVCNNVKLEITSETTLSAQIDVTTANSTNGWGINSGKATGVNVWASMFIEKIG